jgi:hypothetical protein
MGIAAEYNYSDENGTTLFQTVRLAPKTFRQRHRVNGSDWQWNLEDVRRVLYQLPALIEGVKAGRIIFIVEGEKDADRLTEEQLVATCNPMGAGKWTDDYSESLKDAKRVIVVPDNDEPGRDHAQAVAESLQRVGVEDVRILNLPNLPEKGDVSDWLDAGHDIKAFKDLAVHAPLVGQESNWPESLPLRRTTPPPMPFPLDALGPLLSDTAKCIADILQCPDALAGQSVLAAATLASQAHADVVIDGRRYPLSGYFVTVAESGERKSAVDTLALQPHENYQRLLREQYNVDLASWRTEHAAWKKARDDSTKGKKTREAIATALREVGDEPPTPLDPMLTTGEPTYEGLVKLLECGLPTLGVFSDEGGRFLGGHAMNTDNVLKTAAGLSGLWDAKAITRTRAGDGNSVLYGRRLSMHLMVQPNVAGLLFGDELLAGQGLLGRILAVHPRSTKGSRPYKETDVNIEPAYKAYVARMASLLQRQFSLREGSRQELELQALSLERNAKTLWIEFHNHVENEQRPDGPLASISSLASKAAEHAARLAGVLALTRNADAKSITEDDMRCGITLADFYIAEAQRLKEEAAIDQYTRTAERTLEWARKRGGRFATKTLYQLGPSEVRKKAEADKVLQLLQQHGLARPLPADVEVDGKSRRSAWEVRP